MLDAKFFKKLAKDVVPMYRRHIWIDAKDIDDTKFKQYSPEYSIAKKSGKLKRAAKKWANKTAPALTGDLHNSFGLMGSIRANGFTFGTSVYGGRVKNLAKMGRVISKEGKALPTKIENFVMKEAKDYSMKKLEGMIKGKTIRIKL